MLLSACEPAENSVEYQTQFVGVEHMQAATAACADHGTLKVFQVQYQRKVDNNRQPYYMVAVCVDGSVIKRQYPGKVQE